MRKRSKSRNGLLGAIFLELAALLGIFAMAQPAQLMSWFESHTGHSHSDGTTSNQSQTPHHRSESTTVTQPSLEAGRNPPWHPTGRRLEAASQIQSVPSVTDYGNADSLSLLNRGKLQDYDRAQQDNASNARLVEKLRRKFRPPVVASFPSITAANY